MLLDGFRSERETFDRLMNDPAELERELKRGAEKARAVAANVLGRTRGKLGY